MSTGLFVFLAAAAPAPCAADFAFLDSSTFRNADCSANQQLTSEKHPLDQCVPGAKNSGVWYQYTCSADGTTFQEMTFQNENCGGEPSTYFGAAGECVQNMGYTFSRFACLANGSAAGIDRTVEFGGSPSTDPFAAYKIKFNKSYRLDSRRELAARAAFFANDDIIAAHNANVAATYTLGHNVLSDLMLDEFQARYLNGLLGAAAKDERHRNVDKSLRITGLAIAANASLDWVDRGAVAPIKNQLSCGSCWAFSAVGAIEGAYAIAGNPLTSFSEQQLVSCDTSGDDAGCQGGLMDEAFDYVQKTPLCAYKDYPYSSGDGKSGACQSSSCTGAVAVGGHTDVPKGDEVAMLAAINLGPLSVAVDANYFQLYESGVLDEAGCGASLNHGVLVVGYGNDASLGGLAYYLVKNSWGTQWGESGYMRIVRGKDMCGIADSASFPTNVTQVGPPAPAPPAPTPPAATYTITGLPTGGMAINEFYAGHDDVSIALDGQMICANGGQFTIARATYSAGRGTLCDLKAHIATHTLFKEGDTFTVGPCKWQVEEPVVV